MVMAAIMTVVVLLFLFLGGLLTMYARQQDIAAHGDRLFPAVVMGHLPAWVQLIFVVALISALFPSADGAITALTSSTCIDLLGLQERRDWDEARKRRVRKAVHLGHALVFLLLTLGFRWLDDPSMVNLILKLAGYTYGPLLGLFAFGILTTRTLRAGVLPWVALAAPAVCWAVDAHQAALFSAYRMGLELLLVNAALTFGGLLIGSRPAAYPQPTAA